MQKGCFAKKKKADYYMFMDLYCWSQIENFISKGSLL